MAALLNASHDRLKALGIDPMQADIEAHYRWIDGVASRAQSLVPPSPDSQTPTRKGTLTDRVDSILVHKIWGLLIFALIMGALFMSIFKLADPIMARSKTR